MFQTSTNSPVEARVISEVISPLTYQLRARATSAGWPTDVIEKIYIVDSNGSLVVHVPEDIEEAVLDLEYGTIGKMPSPVIRPFIYKYAPEVATSVGLASIYEFAMSGGGVY